MPNTSDQQAVGACDRVVAMIERALAMEQESRSARDDTIRVPLIRYALALVRMRIRPALAEGWLERDPVHVVMFGGTNSGKSTVLNVLLGRDAAGMSYRARFSQHPVAFRPTALGDQFLDAFPTRFIAYRRYRDQVPPRQEDHELKAVGYNPGLAVYDATRMAVEDLAPLSSTAAVFWDLPDFSTEEALAYMGAVLDTVALADLVVMAVTKENYADYRAMLLRALVCSSGATVRVVANKLEDGARLLEDIQKKVGIDGDGTCRVSPGRIHPLPHVKDETEEGRLRHLLSHSQSAALRQAVAGDVATGPALKRKGLAGSVRFLERRLDEVLAPLRAEVGVAEQWTDLVRRTTRHEFFDRYERDYLDGEKYVDFNLTLVKLMDLLEIPGIGPIISGVSKALKKVSEAMVVLAKDVIRGAFKKPRPLPRTPPEEEIVIAAFEQWRTTLTNEAQVLAQRGEHPAWAAIATRMGSFDFITRTTQQLGQSYLEYRERMDAITVERARMLYELIARDPNLLNVLRGIKVTLDVGSTALFVSSGGLDWTDAVIGPLVAPVQRLILEYGVEKYLDVQKTKLKQEQSQALQEVINAQMVAPVLALFQGSVRPEDLEQVRRDFATVKAAALAVGEPALESALLASA